MGVDGERYLAPYYWNLPSIACLDKNHKQRLLQKNLQYETRELTLWVKGRDWGLGLDCGLSATNVLLVFSVTRIQMLVRGFLQTKLVTY